MYTRISSLADKSIASQIYFETKQLFDIQSGSEWAGTVYASAAEVGGAEAFAGQNVNVWGAFYAYDSVDVASGTTFNYVRSYLGGSPAPEPSSLILVVAGLLGLLGYRRSRI